jgi:hypothetical protein
MDLEAFKEALKQALKMVPPELARDFAHVIAFLWQKMPMIEEVGPKIWPVLSNHVMALAAAWQFKLVDPKDIDKFLREAFEESGIVIPAGPTT